jgi:hypothetical protein
VVAFVMRMEQILNRNFPIADLSALDGNWKSIDDAMSKVQKDARKT